LAPLSVRVPVPILVRATVPVPFWMMPENVPLLLVLPVARVPVPATLLVTAPAPLRIPAVLLKLARSRVPASLMSELMENAVALPALRVTPLLIVVTPPKVLTPERVSVPPPAVELSVRPPLPEPASKALLMVVLLPLTSMTAPPLFTVMATFAGVVTRLARLAASCSVPPLKFRASPALSVCNCTAVSKTPPFRLTVAAVDCPNKN